MLFQPTRRWSGVEPTPRKAAAFARKQERQRNALPLFADEIARQQHSYEDDIARRNRLQTDSERARRSMIARFWMEVRARRRALPVRLRQQIDEQWHRWNGPRSHSCLCYIIQSRAAEDRYHPDEFPHIEMGTRARLTDELNRHAMQQVRHWHSQRIYSPSALHFISPFFEPKAGQPDPRLYLDTNSARHADLDRAIAAQAQRDPGCTRTGAFAIENTAFRFEIRYYHPRSNERSYIPWNADFVRRILWVGRSEEQPPSNFADMLAESER